MKDSEKRHYWTVLELWDWVSIRSASLTTKIFFCRFQIENLMVDCPNQRNWARIQSFTNWSSIVSCFHGNSKNDNSFFLKIVGLLSVTRTLLNISISIFSFIVSMKEIRFFESRNITTHTVLRSYKIFSLLKNRLQLSNLYKQNCRTHVAHVSLKTA